MWGAVARLREYRLCLFVCGTRMVELVLTSLPNHNGYALQVCWGALDVMPECNLKSTARFASFRIVDVVLTVSFLRSYSYHMSRCSCKPQQRKI